MPGVDFNYPPSEQYFISFYFWTLIQLIDEGDLTRGEGISRG